MNNLNKTQLQGGPNFDYNCYLFAVVVPFTESQIVSHKLLRLGDEAKVHLRIGNAACLTVAKESPNIQVPIIGEPASTY